MIPLTDFRVGSGFDVHRFAEAGSASSIKICGLDVPHDRKLIGHSDADVGLHALVDAILGAAGQGDIGQHFPPTNDRWKGSDSAIFVVEAMRMLASAGGRISNVDITIICELPKIGPHRQAMRTRVSELLGIGDNRVNIKATTTEGMGFTGRGEGIAAQAVVAALFTEPSARTYSV